MKRLSIAILLITILIPSTPTMALSRLEPIYRGGLMDDQPVNYGAILGTSLGTSIKATDSDAVYTTLETSSTNPYIWYDFTSPQTIDEYIIHTNNGGTYIKLQFYNAEGSKLSEIGLGTQNQGKKVKLATPLENVKRVAVYGKGYYIIYDMNVFSSAPVKPKGIDLSLVRGRNTVVPQVAIVNYDVPRNVNTDNILPYLYNTAPKMVK